MVVQSVGGVRVGIQGNLVGQVGDRTAEINDVVHLLDVGVENSVVSKDMGETERMVVCR